jgi:hypothetical protein
MRTPATVDTSGSSVGNFGVPLRLATETRRTEARRVTLPIAFAALRFFLAGEFFSRPLLSIAIVLVSAVQFGCPAS